MASCEICKKTFSLHQNVIYKHAGQMAAIQLCASHDQELFLIGQVRFLKKYQDQISKGYQNEIKHRSGSSQDAA
jgi:hypothetical protein